MLWGEYKLDLTTAAGIGPGTTAMYMQRTTSGAAGNGLFTTIKYMRGASVPVLVHVDFRPVFVVPNFFSHVSLENH